MGKTSLATMPQPSGICKQPIAIYKQRIRHLQTGHGLKTLGEGFNPLKTH
jgi:hypothetical protein